jgi:hypothetical protein
VQESFAGVQPARRARARRAAAWARFTAAMIPRVRAAVHHDGCAPPWGPPAPAEHRLRPC